MKKVLYSDQTDEEIMDRLLNRKDVEFARPFKRTVEVSAAEAANLTQEQRDDPDVLYYQRINRK